MMRSCLFRHLRGIRCKNERLFLTMSFISAHPTAIPPARLSERYSSTSLTENPDSISSWQSVTRPGTPFIKRVSSVRLPDDQSSKTTEQLPNLLSIDLGRGDETIVNEVSIVISDLWILKPI